MFRIAIVEDDSASRQKLESYIHRYAEHNNYEINLTLYADGAEILENYQPVYDILLMDIEMPSVDGMTSSAENSGDRFICGNHIYYKYGPVCNQGVFRKRDRFCTETSEL